MQRKARRAFTTFTAIAFAFLGALVGLGVFGPRSGSERNLGIRAATALPEPTTAAGTEAGPSAVASDGVTTPAVELVCQWSVATDIDGAWSWEDTPWMDTSQVLALDDPNRGTKVVNGWPGHPGAVRGCLSPQ